MKEIKTSEKLTLQNLTKIDKSYNETEKISLANGQYNLIINKKFRKSKISKLLIDLQKALETSVKEKADLSDIEKFMLIYQVCIIKHFTNLPIQDLDLSKKIDVEKLVAVAYKLLDTGIFTEICDHFDYFELKKIEDSIKQSKSLNAQFGEILTSIVLNAEASEENVIDNGSDSADNPTESE